MPIRCSARGEQFLSRLRERDEAEYDSLNGLIILLSTDPSVDNETKTYMDFGGGTETPAYVGVNSGGIALRLGSQDADGVNAAASGCGLRTAYLEPVAAATKSDASCANSVSGRKPASTSAASSSNRPTTDWLSESKIGSFQSTPASHSQKSDSDLRPARYAVRASDSSPLIAAFISCLP